MTCQCSTPTVPGAGTSPQGFLSFRRVPLSLSCATTTKPQRFCGSQPPGTEIEGLASFPPFWPPVWNTTGRTVFQCSHLGNHRRTVPQGTHLQDLELLSSISDGCARWPFFLNKQLKAKYQWSPAGHTTAPLFAIA